MIKIMKRNQMILLSKNFLYRMRFCIRNQYSSYFNDFDLLRIGKTYFMERIEYKLGLIGFQFVIMYFKKTNQNDSINN